MRYNALDWTAIVLVIVGAINWGLIGLFDFNLVSEIFGVDSALTNIIYVLVCLSGIYLIYTVSRATSSHTIYAAEK